MKKQSLSLDIAKSLISIDTTTSKGVNKAMTWLKKWASDQGLYTLNFPGTKALLIQTNPKAQKHFNFVTHIDVVPALDWESAFKPDIKNDQLIGRGAVDDKGPLAVCLEVLVTTKSNDAINVSCLIVTDEETDNKEIGKIIASGEFNPNFSLVVDGGTHTLMDIGQKGIVRCELSLLSKGGHSAFEESSNSASLQMLEVINELNLFASKQPTDPDFSPTFINVSAFISETVPYGLPELATAHLEIQFPSPQKSATWLKKIDELKDVIPHLNVTVHWISEPHLLKDKEILTIFTSLGLENITTGGNNLAKDLSLSGILASSHCPVTEYLAHCTNEKISLEDLEKGAKLYVQLVDALTSR